jgi:hypothetical protein
VRADALGRSPSAIAMNIVDETLVAATVPECRGELREQHSMALGL